MHQEEYAIKYFKLINGEDIVAKVSTKNQDSHLIEVLDPVKIIYYFDRHGNYSPKMVAWGIDPKIVNSFIHKNHILTVINVSEELTNVYNHYIIARESYQELQEYDEPDEESYYYNPSSNSEVTFH